MGRAMVGADVYLAVDAEMSHGAEALVAALRGFGLDVESARDGFGTMHIAVWGVPTEEEARAARTRRAGRRYIAVSLSEDDASMPAGEFLSELAAMPVVDAMGRLGVQGASRQTYYERVRELRAVAGMLRSLGRGEPTAGMAAGALGRARARR